MVSLSSTDSERVPVVPTTAVPTVALKGILDILRALSHGNLDYAGMLAEDMHLSLHPHLQNNIAALAVLWVIRVKFDKAPGKKQCLCCLSRRIIKTANLSTKAYCCAPGHLMAELCPQCQYKKTIERLEAQAAADARRRPASLYDSDASSDASQGGRVQRRRAAASRTPYARPAARRGVPPRTEYDYMLPPRIVDPMVDALADALPPYQPFAAPRDAAGVEALVARLGDYQPFAEPVADVDAVTARFCNYQPFVAEPAPVPAPAPAPAPAVVQPEYNMDNLVEDLEGHHIPADEPVRGGDDDELSAVIGRFARQTLQAPPPPTWPSLRSEYYGRAH